MVLNDAINNMHSFTTITTNQNPQQDANNNNSALLVAVATLVTEGRIPGVPAGLRTVNDNRRFHEGPHCSAINDKQLSTRHLCNSSDILANKEKIHKFYTQNVPFYVAVYYKFNEEEEEGTTGCWQLLEEWQFSVRRCRIVTSIFSHTQLLAAIRSQLYFSQLTAWLVTDQQLTVTNFKFQLGPTASAAATFKSCATEHEFPETRLDNCNSLIVKYQCAPRSAHRPKMVLDDRLPTNCTMTGKHCCHDDEDFDEIEDFSTATKKQTFTYDLITSKGQLLLDAIERSGQSDTTPTNCGNNEKLLRFTRCAGGSGVRRKITFDDENDNNPKNGRDIPDGTAAGGDRRRRRNLGSTTPAIFHEGTGLPLSSSPAPVRKGQNRFDFDSSLNSVSAIKRALFSSSFSSADEDESATSPCSPEIYTLSDTKNVAVSRHFGQSYRCKGRPSCLLGSFVESVLNRRLEPASTVHGFNAELGASGAFVPKHIVLPVVAYFYACADLHDRVSTPYLGHISLGKKGYNIPKSGTVQITLFNPLGTVVKMFVIPYDLSDMPPNCQTFLRQRTLYMPTTTLTTAEKVTEELNDLTSNPKWLRFLIHVRFMSSKSGKIYLHSDLQMIIVKKSDMDTATAHDRINYEMRSFVQVPENPKYSSRK